jgi:hypothetical protein
VDDTSSSLIEDFATFQGAVALTASQTGLSNVNANCLTNSSIPW